MSFHRYQSYKESGVEWLGQVPAHWAIVPFKHVIQRIESGTSVNAVDTPAAAGERGVLKTSCVYSGEFNAAENKAILPEEYDRASCPLRAGTLIVSRMNTPDLVGAAGLVRVETDELYLPDRLWQLHMKNCEPAFVHFWTATAAYRSQVQVACSGTSSSMQNLAQDQLRTFWFPNPPRCEQTEIVRFLDCEIKKIDRLVEEQQQLIALLKEKRQAAISHGITKGLNPNALTKVSGIDWPASVPAHWEVLPLARVVSHFVDYRGKTPTKIHAGVPLVTATQIKEGRIERSLDPVFISEEEYGERMTRGFPEKGDILITTEAPLGETAQIEDERVALGQRIILMKPNRRKITPSYLFTHFRSQFGQNELWKRASGSTASGIRADRLRASAVLVPPLDEQSVIVNWIAEEVSHFPPIERAIQTQIELLQERRSALISAAVTGKIDVRGLVETEAPIPGVVAA
ncbi:type I restriction enzyme S subunit [Bradyrhizobium japonicum]|uniref:restriction endonuclease subunit S n=1 Tax=Bradyrhizobium japonicum TaxID=375 RepID=UPI002169BDD4|nr:restriction endonuclease subunit S [Bradyrhizobium japonicum]MCS3497478.1 type I restriction enzyme S subunit [Bradyrhizobium japonicum]MCS3960360.1 type I restriction enzyme S subunit [Bradyrhizobium japonicum]MCS4002114.1 type I restriction enzyme S subunit [Bradyrhizobium japonicum]